jgi:hypothetical protein
MGTCRTTTRIFQALQHRPVDAAFYISVTMEPKLRGPRRNRQPELYTTPPGVRDRAMRGGSVAD